MTEKKDKKRENGMGESVKGRTRVSSKEDICWDEWKKWYDAG